MDNRLHNIIVPWDFSPSSYYALEQAIRIAKVRNFTILLLHFIKHHSKDSTLLNKLNQIASDAQEKNGIIVNALITQGSVYKSLLTEASKPEAELIVMKTDGVKGLQKYTGSRAIKMIKGIQIPTIVVQQIPTSNYFDRIVFPIDYRPENKEFASVFFQHINQFAPDVHIFLIKPRSIDSTFKKNIANNLNFIKKVLENKNINFTIIESERGNKAKEIIRIAHSVKADLILAQLQRRLNLTDFLFGVKEQRVIANPYKIPVLCINPRRIATYQAFN
jgi:Universal stress protein UspA and related nucleotide-binding proteins